MIEFGRSTVGEELGGRYPGWMVGRTDDLVGRSVGIVSLTSTEYSRCVLMAMDKSRLTAAHTAFWKSSNSLGGSITSTVFVRPKI